MSRNSESKFQGHLSSTKAMFQYMTTDAAKSQFSRGVLDFP